MCSSFAHSNTEKKTDFNFPNVAKEVYSPEKIRAEFKSVINQLQETQPNRPMKLDAEFSKVKSEVLEQATYPMSQLEAYRLYTRLNPLLPVGSMGVQLPEFRSKIKAAIKMGDRLFPLKVYFDNDFGLLVRTASHGIARGTVIQTINGIDVVDITKKLERRVIGVDSNIRRKEVTRCFAEYLWMHYGSAQWFEIELKEGEVYRSVKLEGSIELPSISTTV